MDKAIGYIRLNTTPRRANPIESYLEQIQRAGKYQYRAIRDFADSIYELIEIRVEHQTSYFPYDMKAAYIDQPIEEKAVMWKRFYDVLKIDESESPDLDFLGVWHFKRELFSQIEKPIGQQVKVDDNEFFALNDCIALCKKECATLLYVDLGAHHTHPLFFSQLRKAKDKGIQIDVIQDLQSISALQEYDHEKKVAKKARLTPQQKRKKRETRKKIESADPLLSWQKEARINKTRLGTFRHFYAGSHPIYSYFIERSKEDPNFRDTNKWKAIDRSYNEICSALCRDMRWSYIVGQFGSAVKVYSVV